MAIAPGARFGVDQGALAGGVGGQGRGRLRPGSCAKHATVVTVHGDAVFAHARRRELVDDFGVTRVSFTCAGAQLRVGELLERFFAAPQLWAPATVASHRWVVRGLRDDAIARRRLVTLTAGDVRAVVARWQEAGVSVPTVSARWLVLRSALSWSVAEGILRVNPVAGMRGPARPEPRTHHTISEVQTLLGAAGEQVERANAALLADPGSRRRQHALFVAEQTRLLVRLAADSAARRELAVLRCSDLAGRVLTIERGLSHGVLGPTKSRRTRRLTLGATTAAMVHDHVANWRERCDQLAVGDWLFSHDPTRVSFLTAGALTHRFRRLGDDAGVADPALHRLRHGVATYLVDEGKILKAQARLGHRDPSTTLRHYSHAVALEDEDVADQLDALLNGHA